MSDSYHTCGDKSCCDQCQTCDDCDGGAHGECDVKENLCKYDQNAANQCNFSNPWTGIEKNAVIIDVLPRSKYNSIIDCIEAAYSRGELVNAGGISISPETGDFITASKTNEIMDAINGLNGQVISGVPNPLIKDEHIVYASYFQQIASGLMSMQLRETACDYCDAACDAQCKTCDACDTCDTGACYTCVTCNTCNSITFWSCSQWGCSQWGDAS